MLNLFELIYDGNKSEDIKPCYLDACTQLSSFAVENPKIVENVISKIQLFLNKDEEQVQGLMLLKVLIKQCSSEVFIQNSYSWLKQVYKILQQHDSHLVNKQLAFDILKDILHYSFNFSELRKQFNELSHSLIQNVMKSSVNELEEKGLECLKECMKYFPGPCGMIKSQIEAHIWQKLVNSDNENKEISSSCLALLVTCGGSGHNNSNYISNWQTQMSKLLSTLRLILFHLYEDIQVDLQNCSPIANCYDLPYNNDESYITSFRHCQYFQTISLCIIQMLSTDYPFQVNIPIEELIYIIRSILNINYKMLNKISTMTSVLISILPSLYSSVIMMLRTLIMSCSKLLLPFNDDILKLLIQMLQYTVSDVSLTNFSKPFSIVRSYVYETLNIFLLKLRMATGLQQMTDILIEQILNDIKPEQIVTKLQSNSLKESKFKSKGCKKGTVPINADLNKTNFKKDLKANYIICKEALKAMQTLLHVSGSLLKSSNYQKIHRQILMLLLEIQQDPENIPVPYNNYHCRHALYSLLLSCLINSPLEDSLPVQTAVCIFSVGQKDEYIKISELCLMALAVCNSIMHPQVIAITKQDDLTPLSNSNFYKGFTDDLENHTSSSSNKEVPIYIPVIDKNDLEVNLNEESAATSSINDKQENIINEENSETDKNKRKLNISNETNCAIEESSNEILENINAKSEILDFMTNCEKSESNKLEVQNNNNVLENCSHNQNIIENKESEILPVLENENSINISFDKNHTKIQNHNTEFCSLKSFPEKTESQNTEFCNLKSFPENAENQKKRPFSETESDTENNITKKIAKENNVENEENWDLEGMIQEFTPCSPEKDL